MTVKEVILNFTEGENEGVEIKLTPPRVIRVGRSEESDVFLGEKKISRKHCVLHLGEDALSITDLDSTNGTFVNSKRLTETLLEDGDRVRIGSSLVEVRIVLEDVVSNAQTLPRADEETGESFEEPVQQPIRKTEDISLSFEQSSDEQEISKPNSFEDQDKEEIEEEDSDLVVEYEKPSLNQDESKTIASASDDELDFGDVNIDGTSGEINAFQEDAPIRKSMTSDEMDLDKIPEIDDISEDMDGDIEFLSDEDSKPKKPAVEAKSEKKKSKALSGDLSAMALPDLLQNLHQNQKTGSLTLNFDGQEGVICILNGQLHSAQVGRAVGSKAIYRMLGWSEGDFSFAPLDESASEFTAKGITPIQESVDGLLMEGMRQLDEINKIKDVLPKMSHVLGLNDQSDVPLSKLHPKVLDVVQLIITHKKTQDVMDLSPLTDLETSKIIFWLIKKKMIKISKK